MKLPLTFLFALTAVLHAEEHAQSQSETPGTPSTQPAVRAVATYYLITDYLPHASYAGDPITCCFRVENASAENAELEVCMSIVDAAGKELKTSSETLALPAKTDRPVKFDVPSDDGVTVGLAVRKKGGADVLAQRTLRLLREQDVWPETKVHNGHLETSAGEVLIPLVRKRQKMVDRSFAPLKWLVDPAPGETSLGSGKGFAFVPGAWDLEKTERRRGLGPYAVNGVPPLLQAAAEIIQAVRPDKDHNAPERVVVALTPEDLDVDTDPRVYRLVLEAMLAHVRKSGVREIVLIPPVRFGIDEKQRDLYWKTVHEVAMVYECQSVDASEYMRETWWRVDTDKDGVYGRKPNKEGLKKFEQALSNLLP